MLCNDSFAQQLAVDRRASVIYYTCFLISLRRLQEAPASNSCKEELEELRQQLGNSAAREADLQVDRICVPQTCLLTEHAAPLAQIACLR